MCIPKCRETQLSVTTGSARSMFLPLPGSPTKLVILHRTFSLSVASVWDVCMYALLCTHTQGSEIDTECLLPPSTVAF